MRYIWLLFLVLTGSLAAQPIRHEFKIKQDNLIYYLEAPDNVPSFPLLIVLEGSYVYEKGPQSVLGLNRALSRPFLNAGIGVVTMERRGVDGPTIDSTIYHRFNTPSQRLSDHIRLLEYLQKFPPENWNGQLIVLGSSEGGPIAIKLAYHVRTSACIILAGCGDQSMQDLIWQIIEAIHSSPSSWSQSVEDWWYQLPSSPESYADWCAMMKAHPDPDKWWFGQTYLYWADALDQTEYQEFLALDCPILVVAGTKDIECISTDRLVDIAHQLGRDVHYLRIEEMGHNVLDPKWKVLPQIVEFLHERRGD